MAVARAGPGDINRLYLVLGTLLASTRTPCPKTAAFGASIRDEQQLTIARRSSIALRMHCTNAAAASRSCSPILEELLPDLHASLSLLLALHGDADDVSASISALLDLRVA